MKQRWARLLMPRARGTTASSTTGSEGLFLFNFLLPGTYQVTAALEGYSTVEQPEIAVGIDRTVTLDLTQAILTAGR